MIIDPYSMFRDNYSETEKLWILVFCVSVAGKNSQVAARKIEKLSGLVTPPLTPSYVAFQLNYDPKLWQEVKLGKYKIMEQFADALWERMKYSSRWHCTATLEELMELPGVGQKTARFYLVSTQRSARLQYAVLDVHVLRWLKAKGYDDVPDVTPSEEKKYRQLEKIVVEEARKRRITPAYLDQCIWNAAQRKEILA